MGVKTGGSLWEAYFCATTCFVLWLLALFFKAGGVWGGTESDFLGDKGNSAALTRWFWSLLGFSDCTANQQSFTCFVQTGKSQEAIGVQAGESTSSLNVQVFTVSLPSALATYDRTCTSTDLELDAQIRRSDGFSFVLPGLPQRPTAL